MAKRKDSSLNGRPLAGRDGGLFLFGDGMTGLFDWHQAEVYDDPELARAAWQRARRPTWQHEYRDDCWPPEGATAYDGITATARRADLADPEATAAAVAADVASVEAFRRRDPAAAAQIAAELAEYVTGLQLLAGLSASKRPRDPFARGEAHAKAMARTLGQRDGAA